MLKATASPALRESTALAASASTSFCLSLSSPREALLGGLFRASCSAAATSYCDEMALQAVAVAALSSAMLANRRLLACACSSRCCLHAIGASHLPARLNPRARALPTKYRSARCDLAGLI